MEVVVRIRTLAGSVAVATAVLIPFAGAAQAAPVVADRDCRDFATREAAQSVFDADTTDPERLDRDDDGLACEWNPSGDGSTGTPGTPSVMVPEDEPAEATEPVEAEAVEADGAEAAVPMGGVDAGTGPSRAGDSPLAPLGLAAGGVQVAGAAVVVRRREARGTRN